MSDSRLEGLRADTEDSRGPVMQAVLIAHLDLILHRLHTVDEYQRRGAKGMTYLDYAVLLLIHTFDRDGGTIQQSIVDAIHAKRWTIRDSLRRLERNGLIQRDAAGLYRTTDAGRPDYEEIREILKKVMRVCEAAGLHRQNLPLA